MPKPPPDYRQLSTETAEAITLLRRRLRTILDRLLPEGYGARSLGRALNVERTTAWRFWSLAHVADPAQALQAMPGPRAREGVFRAFEESGVPKAELASLRESFAVIDPLVFGRRADRSALRSMAAGGLDTAAYLASLREIRRSTVRGAGVLYGVKAKTIVQTWTVAPGPRPGSISYGLAGGMTGICRMRPGLPWPIVQRTFAMAAEDERVFYRPLGDDPRIPSLLRGVSTAGVSKAELRIERQPDRETIDLGEVAPKHNGSLQLFHAEFLPDAGAPDPGPPQLVPLAIPILVPVESAVFSLAFHRSTLPYSEPFASLLHLPATMALFRAFDNAVRVPLEVSMKPTRGFGLPRRYAGLEEGHRAAFRRVIEAQGVEENDFAHYRLELPFPLPFSIVAGQFEMVAGG